MDFAIRRLRSCHLAGNCEPRRGQVQTHATAAPPISATQRALLQTAAARRKIPQEQQGSSSHQGTDGQQQQQQHPLPAGLHTTLFRAQHLADSSPEELEQLMAEHHRRLQLRARQQQQQSPASQRSRLRPKTLQPSAKPQQASQQQHQQQPAAGASPTAASPTQLQQMQLLQQQLALRQLLVQQQQRKRQLQLQLTREPAVLTALIKRSRSWQRLGQLFHEFMPLFNPIHVSAATTHLAQLQEQPRTAQQLAAEPQRYQELVQELTSAVVACTPDFGPRQIANCMWAISRLGADGLLTRKLRNAFLGRFDETLQFAAPQHVANVAAAVANMGWPSDTTWRQRLMEAAVVRMPHFKPGELAMLVHALSSLNVCPSPEWLAGFTSACAQHMPSFTLQELSMLAVGLARLQHTPDREWLAAYLHAVQQQLTPLADHSWPSAAAAADHHQQQQHQEPLISFEQGAQPAGSSALDAGAVAATLSAAAAAVQASRAVHSLPDGQHVPDGDEDDDVPAALSLPAGFTGVQGVVNVLWALASWRVVPPGAWQARCLAAVEAFTCNITLQGASTILWACARLRVQVPQPLLLQLLKRCRALLSSARPTDTAMLVWSLGTMGVTAAALQAATALPAADASVSSSSSSRPGWGTYWLGDFAYHSYRVLPVSSAADLVMLLVGAVRMQLSPGRQWLGSVLVEASHMLPDMDHAQLSATLLCLARLRCKPGNSFLQAFSTHSGVLLDATAAAGSRARRACHHSSSSSSTSSKRRRREQQQGAGISGAWQGAAPEGRLPFYTPQSLANTLGALAMLGYCPPQQWCRSFFAASAALLPCFSGRDFAYTIWALALLQLQPPRDWMDAYLVQLRGRVPSMTSQQLSAVIWGLAQLNHRPGVDWMNRFLDRVVALAPHSAGAEDSSSSGAGTSGTGGAGMPAPPSPLQLSGYFSAIILQGLTAWAASCLDLGFDGSSGSSSPEPSSGSSVAAADVQAGGRKRGGVVRRVSITPAPREAAVDAAGGPAGPSRSTTSDGCIMFRF